jgi:SsrA-binding protein
MADSRNGNRDIAVNRRAFHDYFIDEKYEAGMVLTGTEVKSVRAGKVNLRDGFVRVDSDAAWLENVHISPYAQGNIANHEPMRARKLLLHRDEIASLIGKVKQRGYTLIPLRVYFARNRAKVEIGLARGKRQYDKRQALAEADAKREIARVMRRG